jgi:hypothetical protein
MEKSKESFKNHTDKRISEIQERARKFREDKIKEKMRKKSETHRKRKKEKVRGRKKK